MHKYEALYQGKSKIIEADTLWDATKAAIAAFKVPMSKRGLLSVYLVELAGKPVVHSTSSI